MLNFVSSCNVCGHEFWFYVDMFTGQTIEETVKTVEKVAQNVIKMDEAREKNEAGGQMTAEREVVTQQESSGTTGQLGM